MGDAGNNGDAKITLYTNQRCPWAHRAQIALKELGLEYKEVIVDLDTPREESYLKINPRGLVPSIIFDHPSFGKPQIMVESGPVVHFLMNAYSHISQKIWPTPIDVHMAQLRYRMEFFVDTYFTKVQQPNYFKVLCAAQTDEVDERIDAMVSDTKKHIEPLLEDAKPFFGGSSTLTLAEILTVPFILRLYTVSDGILLPTSLKEKLDDLPNFSRWAHAAMAKESVVNQWDTESQAKALLDRLPKMKERYGGAGK